MRPFTVFCHGSTEEELTDTSRYLGIVRIEFAYQSNIFVTMLTMENRTSLISTTVEFFSFFPLWRHGFATMRA
jgi:hypothetical protein